MTQRTSAMSNEDRDEQIKKDNLAAALEAFGLVAKGGIQAKPQSSGVKIQPPRPFSPNIIDTFADPRRKQPLQFGLMGMPYRSGAPYLGR